MAHLALRPPVTAACRARLSAPAALRSKLRPLSSPAQAAVAPRSGFRAALGGAPVCVALQVSRVARLFRLNVECNRKQGKGHTLEGTRRKRARVSGFRSRIASVGGAKVLAARRKKGRKVLVPASRPVRWNKMKL